MNKIFKTLTLVVAAFALFSCGGRQAESASAAVEEEKAILVSTATAVMQEVPQTEVYSSTVEAYAINNIAPQTPGRIQSIRVDVGSFVGKGQVLATMDAAQLDQTRLKLVNDSTELSRLKSLYEEGGVSKSDYDAVEMAYKVSRRSYNNLAENTYLRSPINGVVTARNYDKGDMYSMTQPIFVVQQIQPVKLLINVSESLFSQVHEGMEFDIDVDSYPGEIFKGKVNLLYPTVSAATHTFPVEVVCQNADQRLRPGMFARVTANFGTNHHVVIPDIAVVKQMGSGEHFVYVLQPDNTVKYTLVELGKRLGNRYEIVSGINEGDRIVTEGQVRLKDGVSVTVK